MTLVLTFAHQSCGICGSSMFAITPLGFTVCKNCGCEQEAENLSHLLNIRDFSEKRVPSGHAFMDTTSSTIIGLAKERKTIQFHRMQREHQFSNQNYGTTVQFHAKNEVTRIASLIGLSQELASKISKYFMGIYGKTRSRKLEHSILVLAPVVIYRCATVFDYTANMKSILMHAQCTRQQFTKVLNTTYSWFNVGKKSEAIIGIIKNTISTLHMPKKVYERAVEILHASSTLSNTTIGIAAASCITIAVFSLRMKKMYPLYKIADSIHVAASSVTHKIEEAFKGKNKILKISDLSEIIPRVYPRMLITSHKNREMAKIEGTIASRIMRVADEMNMRPEARGRAIRILQANLSPIAMATPEVAAGVCIGLSVYSLQLRAVYPMFAIARKLEVSASAITARTYKIVQARGMKVDYRVSELEEKVPHFYERLVGEFQSANQINMSLKI